MTVRSVRFLRGAESPEHFPPAGPPEVAVAGRSNVGKSSLLNRLVGRRGLARVGKTPGRTQQINFFLVDDRLLLVDLPGYGYARVPRAVRAAWGPLVEAYLGRRPTLAGVVVIVDARRGVEADDRLLLDFLARHGRPVALVATKVDKLKRSERRERLAAVAAAAGSVAAVIPFSAVTGEGVRELWRVLERWADSARGREAEPWTR